MTPIVYVNHSLRNLKGINISGCFMPRKIENEYIEIIKSSQLEKLNLSYPKTDYVGNLLLNLKEDSFKKIRFLNLSYCFLTEQIGTQLSGLLIRCLFLKSLNLNDNPNLKSSTSKIISSLGHLNNSLKELQFSNCGLLHSQLEELIEFLKKCSQIRTINISSNRNITVDLLTRFLSSLKKSADCLRSLNISNLKCKTEKFDQIFDSLKIFKNLESFSMSQTFHGKDDFSLFIILLKNCSLCLKHLDVSDYKFNEKHNFQRHKNFKKFKNSTFNQLNSLILKNVLLNEIQWRFIFDCIKNSSVSLKKLILSNCSLNANQIDLLADSLQECHNLNRQDLSNSLFKKCIEIKREISDTFLSKMNIKNFRNLTTITCLIKIPELLRCEVFYQLNSLNVNTISSSDELNILSNSCSKIIKCFSIYELNNFVIEFLEKCDCLEEFYWKINKSQLLTSISKRTLRNHYKFFLNLPKNIWKISFPSEFFEIISEYDVDFLNKNIYRCVNIVINWPIWPNIFNLNNKMGNVLEELEINGEKLTLFQKYEPQENHINEEYEHKFWKNLKKLNISIKKLILSKINFKFLPNLINYINFKWLEDLVLNDCDEIMLFFQPENTIEYLKSLTILNLHAHCNVIEIIVRKVLDVFPIKYFYLNARIVRNFYIKEKLEKYLKKYYPEEIEKLDFQDNTGNLQENYRKYIDQCKLMINTLIFEFSKKKLYGYTMDFMNSEFKENGN